jgi:hypothetical protein
VIIINHLPLVTYFIIFSIIINLIWIAEGKRVL